jgi:DNA-binding protein HU-beta
MADSAVTKEDSHRRECSATLMKTPGPPSGEIRGRPPSRSGIWPPLLSESHDLPKKQAEAVLGDLVTLATRHLKRGDKIRLTGLGILQVRKRAARMGRNPATGEAIKIRASKKIAFRPAKELKEAVWFCRNP